MKPNLLKALAAAAAEFYVDGLASDSEHVHPILESNLYAGVVAAVKAAYDTAEPKQIIDTESNLTFTIIDDTTSAAIARTDELKDDIGHSRVYQCPDKSGVFLEFDANFYGASITLALTHADAKALGADLVQRTQSVNFA